MTGLIIGFGGNYTTVSSFVAELDKLNGMGKKYFYYYLIFSLLVSQLGLILILGIYTWI